MSLSTSLAAYSDVLEVFKRVTTSGKVHITFENKSVAHRWVMRANNYRVLLRKQREASTGRSESDFDGLMIRRPRESVVVTVEPHGYDFLSISDDAGNPLTLEPTAASSFPEDDDEEAIVADLLREVQAGNVGPLGLTVKK